MIKPINYGIACRIGDDIYYNRKLESYPILLSAILQHEHRHTSGMTMKDVSLDLDNEDIKPLKKEYYNFVLTHPSSWTELLPAWRYEGRLVWNPLMTMFWIIALGGEWLLISLLN